MGKPVILSWWYCGLPWAEACFLVDETDTFYTRMPDGEVKEIDNSVITELSKEGFVLFEGREGVFGLYPRQIISIKEAP